MRLKTGKTFVISFVLNQADDMGDYAKCLIMGISEGLRGTHYHLQVLPQNIDQDPMMPVRYIVETAAADGLILTHTEPQDMRVKLMLERGFPFITFGQTELATPASLYRHRQLRLRLSRHQVAARRAAGAASCSCRRPPNSPMPATSAAAICGRFMRRAPRL